MVQSGTVDQVVFEGDTVKGARTSGESFTTYSPETDNTALIGELKKYKVRISALAPKGQNILVSLLINSFPVLLLIGVWVYFMRQMQGEQAVGVPCPLARAGPACSAKIRSR